MIEKLYKKSEELTNMYSVLKLEDYISLSTELSLEFLEFIKTEIPKDYNSQFSTVLARSMVFLNQEQKLFVVLSLMPTLTNSPSLDIQRSYSGIISFTLYSLESKLRAKVPKIKLDPNQRYDYNYICLSRQLEESHFDT